MENKINSLTSEYESQITEFDSIKGKLRGEIEAERKDKTSYQISTRNQIRPRDLQQRKMQQLDDKIHA